MTPCWPVELSPRIAPGNKQRNPTFLFAVVRRLDVGPNQIHRTQLKPVRSNQLRSLSMAGWWVTCGKKKRMILHLASVKSFKRKTLFNNAALFPVTPVTAWAASCPTVCFYREVLNSREYWQMDGFVFDVILSLFQSQEAQFQPCCQLSWFLDVVGLLWPFALREEETRVVRTS